MKIFENEITIESREILKDYFEGYEYRASGLSFSSLYMWRTESDSSWEIFEGYLFVAGLNLMDDGHAEYFLYPPMTKTGNYDAGSLKRALAEVKAYMEAKGLKLVFRLVPAQIKDIIEEVWEGVKVIEDRPNYDYLYLKNDLIELAGKKYHGKKNHLNYFKNNFEYEYVKITPDMAGMIKQFLDDFNSRKDIPPLEMEWLLSETEAALDVIEHSEQLGCICGSIVIDGKLEAFSIGARTGKETVTVHAEKANSRIRGLYQAINNEFCKHLPEEIRFVNREEDMGLENLRKAKLSYKPVELIEKYIIEFE